MQGSDPSQDHWMNERSQPPSFGGFFCFLIKWVLSILRDDRSKLQRFDFASTECCKMSKPKL